MSTIDTWWKETHENRHAWAFRAYDDFVATLSEEVRQRLAHKKEEDEAFVVVFGKTQVGKTTLLMDLMGVSARAMPRVSKVLRGGRRAGSSATATTMEYHRSPDERWGLRIHRATQWFKNDEEMTVALGELRSAMEERRLQAKHPCVVQIPQNCFHLDDKQPLVRMLDLPGDKPANVVERAHVQEMANRYVRQADLILLVGRGDDLGFLKSGELTLPGIEDWQIVPDRFRIVTTYSFTAQSVRDLVRQQENDSLDPEMFRMRLIEQIEKFGRLNTEARRSHRFFPLEFGQSWQDTQREKPELHQRVSPLIHALKQQLRDDIRASTTPMARLKSAVQAHEVVARVKEARLAEMQRAHEALGARLEQANEEHRQAEAAIRKENTALYAKQKRLDAWNGTQLATDLNEHFVLAGTTSVRGPDETVSGFRLMINEARASLKQRVGESRPCQASKASTIETESEAPISFWRSLTVNAHEAEVRRLLDEAFGGFESHLRNDYTGFFGIGKDTYLFTKAWDSDYQKDIRRFDHCVLDAERRLLQAARRWWLDAAKQKLEQMHSEHQDHQRSLAHWKSAEKKLKSKKDALEKECEVSQETRDAFERKMDKELTESRRFKQLLNECYLAELRRRRQTFVQHGSPSRRLIELLGAVHLAGARRELTKVTGEEISPI